MYFMQRRCHDGKGSSLKLTLWILFFEEIVRCGLTVFFAFALLLLEDERSSAEGPNKCRVNSIYGNGRKPSKDITKRKLPSAMRGVFAEQDGV